MKRVLLSLLVALGLLTSITPAGAIENGADATGSGFVVPIRFEVSTGKYGMCSGALVAPLIVVTAGHCVLDSNGILTKNVYVGLAGSSMESISTLDKVISVEITSGFQNAANNRVGDDDLAFLTLAKPQSMKNPLYLASEKEAADMKVSSSVLKVFGYGNYGDTSTAAITFPKSMSGSFSATTSIYTNSAYIDSVSSNVCKGDSGGPVLNISATKVILVGIVTGSQSSVNCTKLSTSGKYLTFFTLIGRYANLAFASATSVMNAQSQTILDKEAQLLAAAEKVAAEKVAAEKLTVEKTALVREISNKLLSNVKCSTTKSGVLYEASLDSSSVTSTLGNISYNWNFALLNSGANPLLGRSSYGQIQPIKNIVSSTFELSFEDFLTMVGGNGTEGVVVYSAPSLIVDSLAITNASGGGCYTDLPTVLRIKAAADKVAADKVAAELKVQQDADKALSDSKAALAKSQSELSDANAALAKANLTIASMQSQFDQLKAKTDAMQAQINAISVQFSASQKSLAAITAQLKKVCGVKPKPKGC